MTARPIGWVDPPSGSGEPEWLTQRRAVAVATFQARGLPSNKDEAWRFTPLGLFRDPAALYRQAPPSVPLLAEPPPPGTFVTRFSDALQKGVPLLARHLGRLRAADHPFAQLN